MAGNTLNTFLKENIEVQGKEQEKILDDVLKLQGKEMEQSLISAGLISQRDLTKLKASYFHIPFISLEELSDEEISHDLIPSTIIKTYNIVPFGKSGNKIKIAISDPTDLRMLEAIEFLAKKNNWDVQLYLTAENDLKEILKKADSTGADVQQALKEFSRSQYVPSKSKAVKSVAELQAEQAPVSKIIDSLVSQALSQGASDIHLEPLDDGSRVRYRVDGILKIVFTFPPEAHPALVSRIKILCNLKIDEQRLPQDGRFRFKWNDLNVDFRVSTFPTAHGEKVVMRVLNRTSKVPSFEDLGLVGQREKTVRQALGKSYGMLLVTGPTGSGKSTTLFVALSQLNKPGVNIVTLEDPVEYVLSGANQAQVNPDIGFTFASGLRSILRQDPNIILVGEIRDRETAELAVHSALTGHVVFSTLHTNDAIGAFPRLIDMGAEPFLIVASVNAVVGQRLVRVLCPDCKKETKVSKEVMEIINKELEDVPAAELKGLDIKNPKIYTNVGCKQCGQTGYKGRKGIFEAVAVTKEIGDLILQKASPHKLAEVARAQGMITMRQDGFIKVLHGITTIEEILRETGA